MSDSSDKEISALYRQASQEQPPAHLDDAVLALAKREARSGTKAVSPFGGNWTVPFSLAAVIVMSVSVITLVQKESPPPNADNRETSTRAGAPQVIKTEKKAENKALKNDFALGDKNAVAQATAPMEEMASTNASRKEKAAHLLADEQVKKRVLPRQPPKLTSPEPLTARKSVQPPSAPAKEKQAVASVAGAQTSEAFAPPENPPPSPPAIAESADGNRTIERFRSDAPKPVEENQQHRKPMPSPLTGQRQGLTQSLAKIQPSADTEESAAQLSAPSSAPSLATPTAPIQTTPIQTTTLPCRALTASQCLQSPQCNYVRLTSGPNYLCRKAVNRCEQDFIQYNPMTTKSAKASCESKPHCRFIPGDCHCLEGRDCDCRGKNPPKCEEE